MNSSMRKSYLRFSQGILLHQFNSKNT